MRPIRCGGIAENEEEYDAIRRESKKRESMECAIFILFQIIFLIGSVIVRVIIGDGYDLFGVYYIIYIVCAFLSDMILCAFVFAVYDKKDKTEGSVPRYVMSKLVCAILMIISAFLGVMFFGMFSLSLGYWTAEWNLPVPIFLALFSLVSAVFSFTLFAYGIMWIKRWSKPWEKLIGISAPTSVPPEVKKVAEPSPAEHIATDDMRSFEEHLRFLRDMYDSGLLDKDEYAEAKKQAFARYGSGK